MASVDRTVIHLGGSGDSIPLMDPNGTGSAENASALVGITFTTATMSVQTLTYEDGNNDGFVDFDETVGAGNDFVTYDLGGGPVSESLDQAVWYDVTLTLSDSSTINTNALVLQTPSGETFFNEFSSSLDGLSIMSIELTSINNNNFGRAATNRGMTGTSVVCFAEGAQILCSTGPKPIEEIKVGQLVWTVDDGLQPVVAVYRDERKGRRQNSPIRLAPGAIAAGSPANPLSISPQHRVLCRSPLAGRMFGRSEVLIAAKFLVGLSGVTQVISDEPAVYFHLELPRHSIVQANGALVESCLPNQQVRLAMPHILAAALLDTAPQQSCRYIPHPKQQKRFIYRIRRNGRPLVEEAATQPCLAT